MSFDLLRQVFDYLKRTGAVPGRQSPLRPSDAAVLLAIADHVNQHTGEAWPSQETIAAVTRFTVREVRRATGRLEAAGLLEVSTRDGRRQVNRYRVHIPDADSGSADSPPQMGTCSPHDEDRRSGTMRTRSPMNRSQEQIREPMKEERRALPAPPSDAQVEALVDLVLRRQDAPPEERLSNEEIGERALSVFGHMDMNEAAWVFGRAVRRRREQATAGVA